jgi:shikimate kinase
MGSGKTTVGMQLARQLAWRFVDLDDRIEDASGLRITEFFERHGEPSFRLLEAGQLRAALGRAAELHEPAVIALGGGTYAQAGAPEFLRTQNVPVIWLDSPIEILLTRCMTMTGRPLFRDESSFRALYAQRLPSYQFADYRVNSARETSLVVADILRLGIFPTADPSTHLLVDEPQS